MLLNSDASGIQIQEVGEMPRLDLGSSLKVLKKMYHLDYLSWPTEVFPKYGDHFFIPVFNTYVVCNPSLHLRTLSAKSSKQLQGPIFH